VNAAAPTRSISSKLMAMVEVLGNRDASDRFELRGELGSGSVGTVYRVFDRFRGEEVALKALRSRSGRDVYRFKREFRSLAELDHPNLVRLHELFAVGDEWMFTMELITGTRFDDRAALPQLVDGLCALHADGKIHRDLKPSNVLVEASGRVVILDFGLVADLETMRLDKTHDLMAVGTPGYMSPEQAADRPLTAASDWYSVGTMLYQVLSGKRPFEGDPVDVLTAKQLRDPPDLRAMLPGDPLADLAMRMLARNPAARPRGDAILAAIGAVPSQATLRIAARARRPATERADELAALHAAYAASRDHHVLVLITGPSGAGKTTLLETFLDDVRASGAVVFHAFETGREALPMPAIDRLVDAYAAWLSSLPPEEAATLIPPRFAAAARVFTALRRLPAAAAPPMPGSLPSDPDQVLLQAFAELIQCTDRVARRWPLVLAVEDIERGTALTLRLVTEQLYRGKPAPYLDVYTCGTDRPTPALEVLRAAPGDIRVIEL